MLSAMQMHRVYFDTNEGAPDDNYDLGLRQSIADLASIPGGPSDGMRVIIYMTGELEMEAILKFNHEWNVWTAEPILETIKHYY